MLEILGTALGIVLIIAFLVGIAISIVVAVAVFRQFNEVGDRHREMTDDFNKTWKDLS
jgi:cytochrome c biogenesis protein CcdA